MALIKSPPIGLPWVGSLHKEEALKALSIKESEHQEQLKEIREELYGYLNQYDPGYFKGVNESIQLIDKYIKG